MVTGEQRPQSRRRRTWSSHAGSPVNAAPTGMSPMQSISPNDLARLARLTEGEAFSAPPSEPRTAHAPPAPSRAHELTADDLAIADEAPTRGKAAASDEARAANAVPAEIKAYSAAPDKP